MKAPNRLATSMAAPGNAAPLGKAGRQLPPLTVPDEVREGAQGLGRVISSHRDAVIYTKHGNGRTAEPPITALAMGLAPGCACMHKEAGCLLLIRRLSCPPSITAHICCQGAAVPDVVMISDARK